MGIGTFCVVRGGLVAKDELERAKEDITAVDFSAASTHLVAAQGGILLAKQGVSFIGFLTYVPWVGPRFDAGVAVLDATQNTVDVLTHALALAQNIFSVVSDARAALSWQDPSGASVPFHDMPVEVKRALFTRLAHALPDLRVMQVQLNLALDDLARFEALPDVGGMHALLSPFTATVARLKSGIDFLVPFSGITREFAGLNGDRQFLLLFLNDTELRPTGGFLGTYGLLTIRDGDMKSLVTDDTYAVDAAVKDTPSYVAPSPAPLKTYLEQPVWFFRDSTWSPDFEAGSRDAIALFRQEIAASGQPVPEIHGTMGITTTFLKNVLAFVGPITVDGQTFTATNAADLLEYQVEVAFAEQNIALSDRKDIVGRLTNALLDKILEISPSRFQDVFALMDGSFSRKELLLSSTDASTEAVLHDAGWSGTVAQGSASDVLMVVDANMASLKSDPVVKRSIDYRIDPKNGGYQATVAITYDHEGSFDWKTSRYRTYTRVYAPAGSTLVSVDGSLLNDAIRNPQGLPGVVTTESEFGLTSFGTFTSVEPGKTRVLTFVYQLPQRVNDAVKSGSYSLKFFKQIGADPRDVTLRFDFNKPIRSAVPAEPASAWGDDTYSVSSFLDTDKEFRVNFSLGDK